MMSEREKMKKEEYSLFQNLFYVVKNIYSWKKSLLADWFLHILISGISIFMLPYLIKVIISQIENGAGMNPFITFIICYAIFALVVYSVNCFCENCESWKHEFIRINFVKKIMYTSLTMDYEYLENPKVLDEQQKAINSVNDKSKGIPGMLNSIVKCGILVVQIVAAGGIIYKLNPLLVLLIIGLIIVQFLPVNHTKEKDKKEVWDTLAAPWRKLFYLNFVARNYEFAKDVRLYNMWKWIFKRQLNVNKEVQDKVDKSCEMWVKCHAIVHSLKFLQELALYVYLVYCILYKGMLISDFTFYIAAVAGFSKALSDFLWEYAGMRNQSMEMNDFRSFILNESVVAADDGISVKEFLKTIVGKQCEFVFENVSFCYEGQTKYALKNINVAIDAGQKIAIVGINGAGKTTLIKLLCRLYEPTQGRILLNGVDIKKFNKKEYYSLFSPVFQNVEMYAFTLAQNVSMNSREKTDDQLVKESLDKAGLLDKCNKLTKGIDTEISKKIYSDGIDMSGGERQKLALARALYKNAPVVLLDEPTAAMDAVAEYELYSRFGDMVEGKTSIYISHRLSSTRFCDKVIMFEDGEIVEVGKHEELLEKNGKYAELYNVQAQYYQEEEKKK